eukprot:1180669-Prorocentrum_minimum.AAC.3
MSTNIPPTPTANWTTATWRKKNQMGERRTDLSSSRTDCVRPVRANNRAFRASKQTSYTRRMSTRCQAAAVPERCFVGIDFGTSGARAMVIDGESYVPEKPHNPGSVH